MVANAAVRGHARAGPSRRDHRGGADVPEPAESAAVPTDHLSRFAEVVLRRV